MVQYVQNGLQSDLDCAAYYSNNALKTQIREFCSQRFVSSFVLGPERNRTRAYALREHVLVSGKRTGTYCSLG